MAQQLYHRRTPSSNIPKSPRTSRPILHRRGTPISFTTHPISKLGAGQPRRPGKVDRQSEMGISFLNFCAMCENQITVPDSSLLYCSEGCRRKDSCKPLPVSSGSSVSPSTTPPSTPPLSPPIIVAPRSPTRPEPSIQTQNEVKSDLDSSDWKPGMSRRSGSSTSLASDAWQYLSQFHKEEIMLPNGRPRHHRRSSSNLSAMSATGPLPQLAHTPSTVASSVNSNASDYMTVHDPANRPLPPLHNPSFCGSPGIKSVELVVPHVDRPSVKISSHEDSGERDTGSIFPASSSVWKENPVKRLQVARDYLGPPSITIN